MQNKPHDIRTYPFAQAEGYVLDANVWLFLYGPSDPTDSRIATYSSAVSRALKENCGFYLDVTILSEYVNRHARLEFDIMREYYGIDDNFKKFRASPAFSKIAAQIALASKSIVKFCKRIESEFATCPINDLLNQFSGGNRDFNDGIIGHVCKKHNLALITDDGDFHSSDIKILSANPKLLRQ